MDIFADDEEELLPFDSGEGDDVFFAPEEDDSENKSPDPNALQPWKVLIVDDEEAIHSVTQVALGDTSFDGRPLEFLSAYSATEAKEIIKQNSDIELILLDVVMEDDDAGLQVVQYIRDYLKNSMVRIVLRTGQPGMAPEKDVIVKYGINDYKSKNELTFDRLFTTVLASLRSYQDLKRLEQLNRQLKEEIQQRKYAYGIINKKNRVFERFVPQNFLSFLGKDDLEDINIGDAQHLEVSILFSDIRDFTSLSENMTYEESFRFLNNYLTFVGPMVLKHGGFIDKYIGDSIMALFSEENSVMANQAVDAAIEMQYMLNIYNGYRKKSGYLPIHTGIGIHTGAVSLGTVGFRDRMDTTVVGDAVNLASRVEGLTKTYGLSLGITQATYKNLDMRAAHKYHIREVDTVSVKGKTESTLIYEVLEPGINRDQEKKIENLKDYTNALDCYKEQQWDDAMQQFEQLSDKMDKKDKLVEIYLQRCYQYKEAPPPENWNQVTALQKK
ncbi:adenylate/guanylate cyclase domain-containing protein [Magnetococcales bacterium HHB-1]